MLNKNTTLTKVGQLLNNCTSGHVYHLMEKCIE